MKKPTSKEIQEAYQRELEGMGVDPDTARKCAKIVLGDSKKERTAKQQATIQQVHNLIFGNNA